jgi:hypothetical protein
VAGIFINYRRDDTAGYAGRIYDRLTSQFGRDRVFMDLDFEPGVDFEQAIREYVDVCDAFLVIIGRHWLSVSDPATGQRRLDDPRDWTRLEVESALERKVRTIPVLVHGARMPAAHELPDGLKRLATRNALELTDARWEYDAQRLVDTLTKTVSAMPAVAQAAAAPAATVHAATAGSDSPTTVSMAVNSHQRWRLQQRNRILALGLGAVAVVLIASVMLLEWSRDRSASQSHSNTVPTAPAQVASPAPAVAEPEPQPQASGAEPSRSGPSTATIAPVVSGRPDGPVARQPELARAPTRQDGVTTRPSRGTPPAEAPSKLAAAPEQPVIPPNTQSTIRWVDTETVEADGKYVKEPKLVKDVYPEWPSGVDRDERVVPLIVTVGRDGRVETARPDLDVRRALGVKDNALIEAVAVDAEKHREYEPTVLDGKRVRVQFRSSIWANASDGDECEPVVSLASFGAGPSVRIVPKPKRVKYVDAKSTSGNACVTVDMTIGPDGRVQDAKVQHTKVHKSDSGLSLGLIGRDALEAVRQWEYEPTVVDGRSVTVDLREVFQVRAIPVTLRSLKPRQ